MRDREIYPDAPGDGGLATAEWREPASFDRLPSIGVSLQPAILRRVAPQQSPLPLHQSPTTVAQSRPSEAIKCAAQLHCWDAVQVALAVPRHQRECHLYFARPVTFLSCADISCVHHLEMALVLPFRNVTPRWLGSGGGRARSLCRAPRPTGARCARLIKLHPLLLPSGLGPLGS